MLEGKLMGVSGASDGALEGLAEVTADAVFDAPFNLLALFLTEAAIGTAGNLGSVNPEDPTLSSPAFEPAVAI